VISLPNPYTPMLLTYTPKRFYGRENEIASILQLVSAPEPGGHAIYGIRTIGKTTLLKYLKDKNGALNHYEAFVSVEYRTGGEKRLFFVYVNFHIFSEGESVFYVMLAQLDEDLQNDDTGELVQFPAYDDETPRQELVNILRRILHRLDHRGIRVVFLLDDFDEPLKTIDIYDDGLLRTLNDYAALIIATEDPISLLRPDLGDSSPLLGILRPDAIGLLSERSARELVCKPAHEVNIELTDEEGEFLIGIAGRQPFLLTAACELYFEMRSEYPDIAYRLQDTSGRGSLQTQFLSQLSGQLHVTRVLQSTWNRLRPEEHRILYNLNRSPRTDLTGELSKIAAGLVNKGLIYWDVKDSVYCIFSQLFAEFIQRTYGSSAAKTLPIPIQPKQPIDNLTPIDSALLKYFIDHKDRICTFEELLDAIWVDGEKSKRALEAAVHRVRKALGPNEQIKNIRGIGYKFVSANAMPVIEQ
jgi:hypothetical protein